MKYKAKEFLDKGGQDYHFAEENGVLLVRFQTQNNSPQVQNPEDNSSTISELTKCQNSECCADIDAKAKFCN